MPTFQIEKDIPVPKKGGKHAHYPFREMEIGDSFIVPLGPNKSPSSVYASISNAKKRLTINLTSARVEGGIRIWRVEP